MYLLANILGPYSGLVIALAIICLVCLAVWLWDSKQPTEDEMGTLYMLYFWGAHSAAQIVIDAIDPDGPADRIRQIYWSIKDMEKRGWVEAELRGGRGGSWDQFYQMTDAGEAVYKRYAHKFGYDYVRDTEQSPAEINYFNGGDWKRANS